MVDEMGDENENVIWLIKRKGRKNSTHVLCCGSKKAETWYKAEDFGNHPPVVFEGRRAEVEGRIRDKILELQARDGNRYVYGIREERWKFWESRSNTDSDSSLPELTVVS